MSTFSNRFPYLLKGRYIEIGVPTHIGIQVPDDMAVRIFATPSLTIPLDGYYLTVIKKKRAGWSNGSAVVMCSCLDAIFKNALVWCGLKTPCKHAKGLRALLNKGARTRKVDSVAFAFATTGRRPKSKVTSPNQKFFEPDWKTIEEY